MLDYVHAIEGRLRVKIPEVKRDPVRAREVEGQFREIDGVVEVRANPLTGNVLFLFEPGRVEPHEILGALLSRGYMGARELTAGAAGTAATGGSLLASLADVVLEVAWRVLEAFVPQSGLIQKLMMTVAQVLFQAASQQVVASLA